jgi:predicted RNase H-like HicB family nuclease
VGHRALPTARLIAPSALSQSPRMNPRAFTYWQDGKQWLGFLDEFPDYMTQGESLEDLKAHLASLYEDLREFLVASGGSSDKLPR